MTTDDFPTHALSPADSEALDALVGAGFDPEALEPAMRPRARRVMQVLGLVDSPAMASASLVDRTLMRTGAPARSIDARLIDADADALDSWMMERHDSARTPSALRERAAVHDAISTLLMTSDETASEDLIERTLGRVQHSIDEQEERLVVPRSRFRFNIADLVSVAAVLLIAGSALWPVMASVRQHNERMACGSNLGLTAMAMGMYSSDNQDALPIATAGFGGGSWWNVGRGPGKSNSANLFKLTTDGYESVENLACPGNEHAATKAEHAGENDWRDLDQVSYSYQIMSDNRPNWSGPRVVILSDRSPVVLRAVRGEKINPLENSPNHAGKGQHVLYNDGTTDWITIPETSTGDNIWLPRSIERVLDQVTGRQRLDPLMGTELPDAASDAFVGP